MLTRLDRCRDPLSNRTGYNGNRYGQAKKWNLGIN